METINIIQVVVYVAGLIGFAFRITHYIKSSSEIQRTENRTDHAKIFDTIGKMAVLTAQHDEKIQTNKRDIIGLKNELEFAEKKRELTCGRVNNIELELAKNSAK